MTGRWVIDASPLITLAKAGSVHLLTALTDELLVPEEVAAEVAAGPQQDSARLLLASGFGSRWPTTTPPASILEWGLGRGETAVLSIALEVSATALLDDAAARRCAAALGIPFMGTLGVVLRAKRQGVIASATEVVAALRRADYRIDDETVRSALASIGET